MSVKTSRPAPARGAAGADLGRQQLALATESACTILRGSEAMRKIKGADHAVATAT